MILSGPLVQYAPPSNEVSTQSEDHLVSISNLESVGFFLWQDHLPPPHSRNVDGRRAVVAINP